MKQWTQKYDRITLELPNGFWVSFVGPLELDPYPGFKMCCGLGFQETQEYHVFRIYLILFKIEFWKKKSARNHKDQHNDPSAAS